MKEKALCHADAHPTCSSMPLHHRNFLKVPVRLEFSRGTRHLADPVPCQDLMGDHLSHVSRAVGAGEAELLPAHRPKLDGIQQKSRDSPFSHGGPFSLSAYQLSFPVNAVHAHLFQIVQHHQVSLVSGTYGA
mgnify:CR=1 FL=1